MLSNALSRTDPSSLTLSYSNDPVQSIVKTPSVLNESGRLPWVKSLITVNSSIGRGASVPCHSNLS